MLEAIAYRHMLPRANCGDVVVGERDGHHAGIPECCVPLKAEVEVVEAVLLTVGG